MNKRTCAICGTQVTQSVDAGYEGPDCSLAVGSPPTVLRLTSGPTCETRETICGPTAEEGCTTDVKKCASARLIVDDFDITRVFCKVVSAYSA